MFLVFAATAATIKLYEKQTVDDTEITARAKWRERNHMKSLLPALGAAQFGSLARSLHFFLF